MPEFTLRDTIITSLNAQEPWPDNVKLFQPYEVEQILLPDNASCLAVQAFLKMANLPFEVEMRWNAEFMSPSGRVPFIKCGAFVVSELEPIVQFAASKGVSLCSRLSTEEKAEMRAYMSLITNVLVNAELYISWLDEETFNTVTKVRNSSVYPWPLGWFQTRSKRAAVAKRLKALNWHDKTLDQVLADVEQCCNSLSQRLGEKDYFFETPTPVDALIYGHMRALLSASGPKAPLMIKPITGALLRHTLKMANLTQMVLMPQEEYLITQAFNISKLRRLALDRTASDRSPRARRSKLCVLISKDDLTESRDVFGFKPFASKNIIIMSSKSGQITCEVQGQNTVHDHNNIAMLDEERYTYVNGIVEEILAKVHELSNEDKSEFDIEANDFEIVYPHIEVNDRFERVDLKVGEYLDTIEEIDMTDGTISVENNKDVINFPQDENVFESPEIIKDVDSDGLVNDNLLNISEVNDISDELVNNSLLDISEVNDNLCSDGPVNDNLLEISEVNDNLLEMSTFDNNKDEHNELNESVNGNEFNEPRENNKIGEQAISEVSLQQELSDANSSNHMERGSVKDLSMKHENSELSSNLSVTDSTSTLKLPSNEEMSVSSLLKILRKRNAVYKTTEDGVADYD